MSNTKFKSGDKVVFCKSSLESGMIDADEGDVFTVHAVYNCLIRLKELPEDYHDSHFEHYGEKEKVMEKYIPEVGDKVKGFVFNEDDYPKIGYNESMDDVVGEQGTVSYIYEDRFEISFSDTSWAYPLELAHLAKIEEPSKFEDSPKEIPQQDSQIDWQVGQEVFCLLRGKGVVVRVGDNDGAPYVVCVDFGYTFDNYTIDGKIYDDHKNRTLFFSEPKLIAETKPPKKPFVPVFKQGVDVLIKSKYKLEPSVWTVVSETEDRVYISNGDGNKRYYTKQDIEYVRILGEQVRFS